MKTQQFSCSATLIRSCVLTMILFGFFAQTALAQTAEELMKTLKQKAKNAQSIPQKSTEHKDSLIKCFVSGHYSTSYTVNSVEKSKDASSGQNSVIRVSVVLNGYCYGVYHGLRFDVDQSADQHIQVMGSIHISSNGQSKNQYYLRTNSGDFSGSLSSSAPNLSFRYDHEKGKDDFSSIQLINLQLRGSGETKNIAVNLSNGQKESGVVPLDTSFAGMYAGLYMLSKIPRTSAAFLQLQRSQGRDNPFLELSGATFSGNDTAGWSCISSTSHSATIPKKNLPPGTVAYTTETLESECLIQLIPVKPHPEVTINLEIPGYSDWLPKGNVEQDMSGDMIQVTASLVQGKDQPTERRAFAWHAELKNTSSEPGICIDFPKENPTTAPDMTIEKDMGLGTLMKNKGTQSIVVQSNSKQVTFFIYSFDFGGVSELKVWADMDDGSKLEKVFYAGKEIQTLPIPYRENPTTQRVADAYLSTVGKAVGTADNEDNEHVDGQKSDGDGLTVFEEYRGIIVDKDDKDNPHHRLNPTKKDLTVINLVGQSAQSGLQRLGQAGCLTVTDIKKSVGIDTNNAQVNFNSQYSKGGDQYGLVLKGTKGPPSDVLGKLFCKVVDAKGHVVSTTGSQSTMESRSQKRPAVATSPRYADYLMLYNPDSSPPATLAWTVAHELAHGLGVQHHGMPEGGSIAVISARPNFRFLNSDGSKVDSAIFRKEFENGTFVAGTPHCSNSGDPACIMCYGTYLWSADSRDARAASIFILKPPGDIDQAYFCSSSDGAYYNSDEFGSSNNLPYPMWGSCEAGFGNCFSQIVVKDW